MTQSLSQEDLRCMVSLWLPEHQVPNRVRVLTDTTDFFKVDYDDVVLLEDKAYLIRHNAKELRFGLEDEIKFWVKRAIDLNDGSLKIMKLVFYEKFVANVGGIEFECFRSPRKEARVMELVAGHKAFMHGYSTKDAKGNVIRVLDFIKGKPLSTYITDINMEHEEYFFNLLPNILDQYFETIQAIRFLHEHGEKHGDIRRDHILIDRERGYFRWIDFDYNYRHRESIFGYDLFGLGNILVYLVGRGDVSVQELKKENPETYGNLREEDVNIVYQNRVVNLKKVYPYIPESLNKVMLYFSKGAEVYYNDTTHLLDDLGRAREDL